MSCRVVSSLPPLLVLVPILLMIISTVQCQDGTGVSLIGALLVNKVERCIDKLNAIADFITLLSGGV